ncbi:rho GTPase-activating protein conundrum [Cimex lectularius]|uniref:Rho-GAP domain-containing protein n=1 Tax=Cimex lectularius TaxID=79782 RepID=A0A8I6R675_CIMLE|nr:rho GTPase-activating protein conundrum [Cimex lectularius]
MEALEDNREFQDYWNEYRILLQYRPPAQDQEEEPTSPCAEGECSDERAWLEAAGLSEVTEPAFLSGREISDTDLSSALRMLSREQAAAVRRRVDSLNKTVRQRTGRYRQRKDIRQLFADPERLSNDSRSRSATPDSLDSGPPSPHSTPSNGASPPRTSLDYTRLMPIVPRQESRRRGANSPNAPVLSHHSLFRRASRSGGDVASETADGIRMTGYQRIGSVRVRCGSDPISISSIGQEQENNQHPVVCVTRSDEGIFNENGRRDSGGSSHSDTLGFEEMWAGERLCASLNESLTCSWEEGVGRTWVDFLAEEDLQTLRPIVFLELTALMDNSGLRVGKSKPYKRKRKEDGNLFGVSLSTLVERDRQITSDPHYVPLVFQKVLGELERRCLCEEGLLRVAGNKQRVEILCSKLEREFYQRPEVADHLISIASPHDLATILKKLLRELPQPLLTSQLLSTFYQAHSIPECARALNLLVLLLPPEHRATLHALLIFLTSLINNSVNNKMSLHNTAMIIAPSLFPQELCKERELKAEVSLAVHSCKLTEVMIQASERLWVVPDNLVAQLRRINDNHKENKPKSRLLGRKGQVITRNAIQEAELLNSIIHIEAPQFLFTSLPLSMDKQTTAAQVILRIVELARECPRNVKSTRRDAKSRALSELAPNGNLSCLLSTGDPETALRTHFLYEVGGNIGQRRLEPGAQLWAVFQSNPRAKWVIRCDHKNGSHRLLKRL